jgi:hypothetical protein
LSRRHRKDIIPPTPRRFTTDWRGAFPLLLEGTAPFFPTILLHRNGDITVQEESQETKPRKSSRYQLTDYWRATGRIIPQPRKISRQGKNLLSLRHTDLELAGVALPFVSQLSLRQRPKFRIPFRFQYTEVSAGRILR